MNMDEETASTVTSVSATWLLNNYVGHWVDGQILADGGTLGKRKPWDSGKLLPKVPEKLASGTLH
jgi:hypothetical protein